MGLPLIQAHALPSGAQTNTQAAAMSRLNANKTHNDMIKIKGGRKYKKYNGGAIQPPPATASSEHIVTSLPTTGISNPSPTTAGGTWKGINITSANSTAQAALDKAAAPATMPVKGGSRKGRKSRKGMKSRKSRKGRKTRKTRRHRK